VVLDAMGTLLTFEPPAPYLAERLGVPLAVAERAIRDEIAFYRAHLHEGRDAASLADLRRRAAEAMRPALGTDLDSAALTAALLASLRFRAYPDAAPALRALRALGLRIVVLSNWDASLGERLAETGLAGLVDAAVASAALGRAKPEPEAFAAALALVDVPPGVALHAGDSLREDVEGALAAGLRAVLVARDGAGAAPPGVPVIESLAGLPALCQYA
jgi:putative hydrolase of the HAD superfamily